MPLRKLWNALRGTHSPLENTTVEVESCAGDHNKTASPAGINAGNAVAKHQPSLASPTAAPSRGLLGFGRSPHDALCRLIAKHKTSIHSVLEIGVGDGTRAIEVVASLVKGNPHHAIRYLAIDQFEQVGGPITLMQFHRALRQSGMRPQIFPEDVRPGLVRIGYTFGAVDLVLISQNTTPSANELTTHQAEQEAMSEESWGRLLSRVTHQDSIVLKQDSEGWKRLNHINQWSSGLRRSA